MPTRQEKLIHLLRLEVVDKSYASSLAFTVFAVFSFIYKFNCIEYAWLIQLSAVLIAVVNLTRFFFCRRINSRKNITDSEWRVLEMLIWINALGWSIIVNSASFELKLQGQDFIVVTTLIAGFVGSSIVTLAYFPSLFIPFQVLLLFPQIVIISYFYFSQGLNLLQLVFLYVMYLVYQLKQYQVYRKENLKRFIYQLDLEHANEELKSSKEELIDQTVKLVHVSRLAALGEMSAGIAHEINNPLTIMKGGAQLIEKNVSRENLDKEMIIKQSQKIQNSVNRVTKIIQGLKSFSNLSDSKPKENVEVKDIIEDTLNFCTEVLAYQGIKLEIESIPDYKIECHPVQISQVLINLIKNAQDEITEKNFDEKDRWIKLQFSTDEHNVSIHVVNGGEKIQKELTDKIFSPFFSTKPVGKGTGLGLSISQKIMREHHGDLAIDQIRPNTTFTVSLPIFRS